MNKIKEYLWILLISKATISYGDERFLGNSLLKKRIIEKRAALKVDKLIENNSMTIMRDRLDGMNQLLDTLHVTSADEALASIKKLQHDLKQLLDALGSKSTDDALKEVKQVKAVVKQLTQIQTTLKN